MLKASLGFMFSHGFRARSQPGHHIAIIDFVRARIGKKHAGLISVFDRLRRKRNLAPYDDRGFARYCLCTNCVRIQRIHAIGDSIEREAGSPICWQR